MSYLQSPLNENIRALFVFDLRSLSLMRITVALTLATDLLVRVFNLKAHYSDQGVLPVEALYRMAWNDHYFSIHAISGSLFIQTIIFTLNLFCIFFLLIGYRTKLFTFLCWLFLVSLHNRNPLVHQGGDDLLRLILFWGMFLPWNYYYSIDSKRIVNDPKPMSFFTLAGFAYMLQVGYVYFFSAILKSSPEWVSEYSALYYALSIDQIVLPLGKMLYPYEDALRWITMFVYYTELLLPLFLLVPYYPVQMRSVFIFVITLLHIGIALCLNVGLFPLIAVVALTGMLPGNVSARIARFFASLSEKNFVNFGKGLFNFSDDYISRKVHCIPWEKNMDKVLILFFAVYVINWNLKTVKAPHLVDYSNHRIAHVLRVDQHWGMFSPAVFKDDGWFIFSALTADNREIDILQRGKNLNYAKLASVSGPFKEDRWRKFSENILMIRNAAFRPYYCSFLINQWNKTHSKNDRINAVQIIYMKEVSLPGYLVDGPKKEVLCECTLNE